MQPDRELLNEFTRSRSEEAFRALVERHIDLVHSVAHRVTLDDDLARDVSQAVFVKLASRPDDVPHDIKLLAWLHRTTRHKAIDLVRSENRRRRREHAVSQIQKIDMEEPEKLDWKALEPLLESALAKLSETDRTLILARYYRKDSHASTGAELGITEDAARMRTKRALDKLRRILGKRGITTTTSLLASAVATNAVTPAPPSLASSITLPDLAIGTSSSFFESVKLFSSAIAVAVISIPIFLLQHSRGTSLKTEVTSLKSTVTQQRSTGESDIKSRKRSSSLQRLLSLEQILAIPDPQERLTKLLLLASSVRTAQIPSTIANLQSITPDWDQDAAIATQLLYTRWGKSDLNSALDLIERLDYGLAKEEIGTLLATLAAEDPQRAADWLNAPDNKLGEIPGLQLQLAGAITKEWARHSPEAAVNWALSLDESKRTGAMEGLLGTISASHRELLPTTIEKWQTEFPTEASAWKARTSQ